MSLKKLNLNIYEYNNGLYVSAGDNRVFAKTPSFSLTGNQSDENTPNMGDTMEYRKLGGLDVSALSLIHIYSDKRCRLWVVIMMAEPVAQMDFRSSTICALFPCPGYPSAHRPE